MAPYAWLSRRWLTRSGDVSQPRRRAATKPWAACGSGSMIAFTGNTIMTLGAFILGLDLFRKDDGYAPIGVSIEIAAYLSREHDHAMADEEIPENVDLRFLAEQQTRILRELAHMRQDD
jgi:hypothetical protein